MLCNPNVFINDLLPTTSSYFKEDLFCQTIILPKGRPDIKRVSNIIVSPEVINLKLINTPIGISNEGQSLTGLKLIVEVLLKQKITYAANNVTESVHAMYYETLKSFFVIVPFNTTLLSSCGNLLDSSLINVSPFVEGISLKL